MQNIGKVFESQIQKSVPDYALMHRLPDAAQAFGGGNKLRFSRKNPFDYILWDSKGHILYALELKTVKEKSISFERTPEDKGEIHYYQIEGLTLWSQYDGIIAGFIIEFRSIETTIFLEVSNFNRLISIISKKSFNLNDLKNNQIPYVVIPQQKARTRYIYDVDYLLQFNRRKEFIQEESK